MDLSYKRIIADTTMISKKLVNKRVMHRRIISHQVMMLIEDLQKLRKKIHVRFDTFSPSIIVGTEDKLIDTLFYIEDAQPGEMLLLHDIGAFSGLVSRLRDEVSICLDNFIPLEGDTNSILRKLAASFFMTGIYPEKCRIYEYLTEGEYKSFDKKSWWIQPSDRREEIISTIFKKPYLVGGGDPYERYKIAESIYKSLIYQYLEIKDGNVLFKRTQTKLNEANYLQEIRSSKLKLIQEYLFVNHYELGAGDLLVSSSLSGDELTRKATSIYMNSKRLDILDGGNINKLGESLSRALKIVTDDFSPGRAWRDYYMNLRFVIDGKRKVVTLKNGESRRQDGVDYVFHVNDPLVFAEIFKSDTIKQQQKELGCIIGSGEAIDRFFYSGEKEQENTFQRALVREIIYASWIDLQSKTYTKEGHLITQVVDHRLRGWSDSLDRERIYTTLLTSFDFINIILGGIDAIEGAERDSGIKWKDSRYLRPLVEICKLGIENYNKNIAELLLDNDKDKREIALIVLQEVDRENNT